MLPSFDLPSAIQACEEAIRLNESAHVDRIGRYILDANSDRLRRFAAIARDELARAPGGCPTRFGVNDKGPALADVIASCEYHRINSAVRKVRAA